MTKSSANPTREIRTDIAQKSWIRSRRVKSRQKGKIATGHRAFLSDNGKEIPLTNKQTNENEKNHPNVSMKICT